MHVYIPVFQLVNILAFVLFVFVFLSVQFWPVFILCRFEDWYQPCIQYTQPYKHRLYHTSWEA